MTLRLRDGLIDQRVAFSRNVDTARPERSTVMWDTANDTTVGPYALTEHLTHDLPCTSCGHAVHTFLPCGDGCACPPVVLPGSLAA
jgi:hypothetical protein